MVTRKKEAGFTLIELLLATSLLMLVLFSGYYGYSLYTQKWQKRTHLFWEQSQQSLAFDAMSRVFESTFPYIVNSDKNEPAQYFSGDQDRIIFMTSSPLFSNKTSVVEFKVIQKDDTYSLLYNEASMQSSLILKQSDEITWQHQIVLIENLKEISFEYFGWSGFNEAARVSSIDEDSDVEVPIPQIYKKHVMEDRRILPISINLIMTTDKNERSIFPIGLPEGAYSVLIDYLKVEV